MRGEIWDGDEREREIAEECAHTNVGKQVQIDVLLHQSLPKVRHQRVDIAMALAGSRHRLAAHGK